ncbi:hypothetical protein [Rhodanobacter sp. B04]|uniref:hypothetical protein n=1 Tax=Rhodanobacter sp. B04 TaxID=1945860 RepID=UPI001115790D|nr:hypothetical protein [Rhodanobacter sp. B04]
MPRSSDEKLRTWATRCISNEPGSCDAMSRRLQETVVRLYPDAIPVASLKTVMIKGCHQDHKAVSLRWSDEESPVMVDSTIGQFYKPGRDDEKPQIFIGSYAEWTAELSRLHNGATVEKYVGDDRASSIWATLEEGRGDSALKKEQLRHSGRVNKETHEAKVLAGCGGCTLL